jgi:hypothetical protein
MALFRSRKAADSKSPAVAARGNGSPDALARINELVSRNREQRDPETERELVAARHAAFGALATDQPPQPADPDPAEDLAVEQQLPVIAPHALTAGGVRAAIMARGCVHVPGLLDPDTAARLAEGIDRTFEACDAALEQNGGDGGRSEWYAPFKPLPGYRLGGGRKWNREGGAIWAADSPRCMFEILEAFERVGVRDLIADYLGERPALSMNKSVLRRVSPKTSGADWHQDGAFLGEGIRSLNVWLTLSRCGDVAPGMDVVPLRLEQIVETGTDGANFDWSVSPAVVERVGGETGVVRPVFEAGDALLFDHMFLHRTASEPSMTLDRYAIETWFFAPSAYPADQAPLVF